MKFITCLTAKPDWYLKARRSTSRATNVRKLPMCPRAYTVNPHVYMRTVLLLEGAKSSSRRLRVLKRRMKLGWV